MMRAQAYTPAHADAWDEFVAASANGCFLHTRRFYAYHGERMRDCSLLLYRKNQLRGVIPAAWRGDEVASHPGCTFGGLVFGPQADSAEVEEMLGAAQAVWSDAGATALTVTLPPLFAHRSPHQAMEDALSRAGYSVAQESFAFVPLAGVADEARLLDGYRPATAQQVRQAQRNGLTAAWSDDVAGFWALLERNLADRHDSRPVHTLAEIDLLRDTFGDAIRLLGVHHEGALVAGTLVFDYGTTFHTQYIATDYARAELRPTNLLYHALLVRALAEGRPYASFGISSEGFGGAMNAGLRRFKEGFGARPALFQRYRRVLALGADA